MSCCLIEKPLRMMGAYGMEGEAEKGGDQAEQKQKAKSSSSSTNKRPRKSSLALNTRAASAASSSSGYSSGVSSPTGSGAPKQIRKESAPPSLSFSSLGRKY